MSNTVTLPEMLKAQASDVPLPVDWAATAQAEAERIAGEPRFGGDVAGWHETRVRAYAKHSVPAATRARIRYAPPTLRAHRVLTA